MSQVSTGSGQGRPPCSEDDGGGAVLPELRLYLLGCWRITGLAAGRVPPAVRRLTAYLSLRGPSSREEVAAGLWPDADDAHASASLRSALWRVRSLHTGLVDVDGGSVALGSGVRVDVAELAQDVRRLEAGELPARLRSLPHTLLVQDLLTGWYDEWLVLDRERVRQLRLHALERISWVLASEQRFALALEAALAAVRIEPLRESAHRTVIGVHVAEGNRSEALRHYQDYRSLLRLELGIEPSNALESLVVGVPVQPGRQPLHAGTAPTRLAADVRLPPARGSG